MNTVITRMPLTNEIPALRGIWAKVFGSIGEDSFFRHYYNPELCVVAECKSLPVAVGYLIPSGSLVYGGKSLQCAMIYSVATLPEFRGMGYGTAVVRKMISLATELDYPAVVLCPSTDELFEYYSTRTNLQDWFYVNEQIMEKIPVASSVSLPVEISADEYKSLRDDLLKESVHIRHDLSAVEYQALLCKELGGGLYRVGDACAIVECQPDGAVWIKELLTPGSVNDSSSGSISADSMASIAREYPSHKYIVRQPSMNNNSRRFGMLALKTGVRSIFCVGSQAPWYGMAFD